MKITGALLAGGGSRRFAGSPKAQQLDADGVSMSERATRCLRAVADDVVVLGHGQGCPPQLERLVDAVPDFGPLAGLLSLLRSERADGYLIVPCDLPHLTAAPLSRLADEASDSDASIAILERGDRLQPLPLWLRPAVLPTLERLAGEGRRSLVKFVESLDPLRVPAQDDAWLLSDADTPEELDAMIRDERNQRNQRNQRNKGSGDAGS